MLGRAEGIMSLNHDMKNNTVKTEVEVYDAENYSNLLQRSQGWMQQRSTNGKKKYKNTRIVTAQKSELLCRNSVSK